MAPPLIVLILAPVESRSLIRTSLKNKLISCYKHFIQKRLPLLLLGMMLLSLRGALFTFGLDSPPISVSLSIKFQKNISFIATHRAGSLLTKMSLFLVLAFFVSHIFSKTETSAFCPKQQILTYLLIITISNVVSKSSSIIYNEVT